MRRLRCCCRSSPVSRSVTTAGRPSRVTQHLLRFIEIHEQLTTTRVDDPRLGVLEDTDKDMKVIPNLAESFKLSDDAKTLTIKLVMASR